MSETGPDKKKEPEKVQLKTMNADDGTQGSVFFFRYWADLTAQSALQ